MLGGKKEKAARERKEDPMPRNDHRSDIAPGGQSGSIKKAPGGRSFRKRGGSHQERGE